MRLFAVEHLLDEIDHHRDTGRAADEHDFIDVARFELGILECLLDRLATAFDERIDEFLELRS